MFKNTSTAGVNFILDRVNITVNTQCLPWAEYSMTGSLSVTLPNAVSSAPGTVVSFLQGTGTSSIVDTTSQIVPQPTLAERTFSLATGGAISFMLVQSAGLKEWYIVGDPIGEETVNTEFVTDAIQVAHDEVITEVDQKLQEQTAQIESLVTTETAEQIDLVRDYVDERTSELINSSDEFVFVYQSARGN